MSRTYEYGLKPRDKISPPRTTLLEHSKCPPLVRLKMSQTTEGSQSESPLRGHPRQRDAIATFWRQNSLDLQSPLLEVRLGETSRREGRLGRVKCHMGDGLLERSGARQNFASFFGGRRPECIFDIVLRDHFEGDVG